MSKKHRRREPFAPDSIFGYPLNDLGMMWLAEQCMRKGVPAWLALMDVSRSARRFSAVSINGRRPCATPLLLAASQWIRELCEAGFITADVRNQPVHTGKKRRPGQETRGYKWLEYVPTSGEQKDHDFVEDAARRSYRMKGHQWLPTLNESVYADREVLRLVQKEFTSLLKSATTIPRRRFSDGLTVEEYERHANRTRMNRRLDSIQVKP